MAANRLFLLQRCLIGLMALTTAGPSFAAPPVLQAPEEISALIEKYLPDLKEIDTDRLDSFGRQALRRDLRKRIIVLLATEGYFSPEVRLSRDSRETDASGPMTLSVIPGPRILIESVDIVFAGPSTLAAEREARLRDTWSLPVGKPFRQADWDQAKNAVLSALLAEDYALAQIGHTQATINPATHQARLNVVYHTGPRILIGDIRIEGMDSEQQWLVDRYNRSVKPGDPYREETIRALQAALQSSPYFSQVLIELQRPDPGPLGENELDSPSKTAPSDASETIQTFIATINGSQAETLALPLIISVRERVPYRIGLGVGASSNTGVRAEINYHSTHAFGYPWEFNSALRIEQRKQTAFADFFLPPETNGARYSFGTNFEHTDIENLDTKKIAIGLMRDQRIGPFDTNLGLSLQQEKRKPENDKATTQTALALLSGVTWRQIDSAVLPRKGHIIRLEAGGATKAILSDQNFLRLYGRYQGYLPVGKRDVFSLRSEIGITLANSSKGIPQDYLFRTGGTQTVRGYSYQSLGVAQGNTVLGGRYLGIASAEYTHWLAEPSAWGIATFVDAGNAADKWIKPAIGAGLGARYLTPAGPVAVDLAYGFDKSARAGGLHLHFTLAIPF